MSETWRKDKAYKSQLGARRKKLDIVIAILLVVFAGVVIEFLFRAPRFDVRNIEIEGVSGLVLDNISGNYLWIFPRANRIHIDEETLVSEIKRENPSIESIEIIYEGHTMRVIAKKKIGIFTWCETDCYYVDQRGEVFERAPSGIQSLIRLIGPIYEPNKSSGFPKPITWRYFEQNEFEGLKLMIEGVLELGKRLPLFGGLSVINVLADKNGGVELTTSAGWIIRYNVQGEATTSLRNLIINLESDDLKYQLENGKKLEYIDLRFGNKVYTKYK